MQTRRQFVSKAAAVGRGDDRRAGGPRRSSRGRRARGKPLRSAGAFSDGDRLGRPDAELDRPVVAPGRREERRAPSSSRSPSTRPSRRSSRARTSPTGPDVNGALKAQVSKLKPYEEYFYRFSTKTKDSPVGRFRTALPAGSKQPVNFAFWSCQDYTHGWYNALEHLNGQDLDFVVCLGDYIYDESYHTVKDGTGVRDDTIGSPLPGLQRRAPRRADARRLPQEVLALPQGREPAADAPAVRVRLAVGRPRGAGQLRRQGTADGGLPAVQKYSTRAHARRATRPGTRACRRSAPARARARRSTAGCSSAATVDLIIMDQRQYRDNQPCDDAVAPACADWDQPRDFLGAHPDELGQGPALAVEGRLEGHGQRGHDHADEGPRRRRSTPSTAGRATRVSARSC